MSRSANHPALSRFALFTAIMALALIGVGGLVTSHEAGLAVPDWPTTYGSNMFLFPPSKWVGGIFYEHTHRLLASGVGLLTAMLAVWLWVSESRAWLRWLGVAAFLAVVLQGVLGGLRVVLFKDEIGIFHAALAQMFFVLVCAIALFASRWWRHAAQYWPPVADRKNLRTLLLGATVLIFGQLVIAATMRHQHAGLSIPDFPLAYHKLWPPTDPASIASYNQQRIELNGENPITAFQIYLQMIHRFVAVLIFCAVILCAVTARRAVGARHPLARFSLAWAGLIGLQIVLGAVTIWSNKAPDIATAHVVVGAMSFATGALLTIVSFRVLIPVHAPASAPVMGSENRPFPTGKAAATNSK